MLIKHFQVNPSIFIEQSSFHRHYLHTLSSLSKTKVEGRPMGHLPLLHVDDILHLSPVAYGGYTYMSIIFCP